MNTERKTQQVKQCVAQDCGVIFQMAGDVPIGLIFPRPVPHGKAGDGKCPLHADKKGGDE